MPWRRALLAGFALMTALLPAAAGPEARRMSVVELFTSQGCSSCPPADALLKTYADRPDVVALTLNVDYWDYLGWKDTLASPKYTKRQRHYAKAFGGQPYTPQVVINGAEHVIGSHAAEIDLAIERTSARLQAASVPLALVSDGRTLTIEIGAGPALGLSGTVWLAAVRPRVDVDIERGENRGRKLSYFNVVRELTPVGMWSGKPVRLELPHVEILRAGERCAVWLQVETSGHIVAAAWMSPR
ncbi:MAG TPA: DUF1223 domain-containing protein [Hyphomicrobiaceae bacterium]|nr:DUF1223 domain-containing protein [Hyphomicrobiaceae bacterium]